MNLGRRRRRRRANFIGRDNLIEKPESTCIIGIECGAGTGTPPAANRFKRKSYKCA